MATLHLMVGLPCSGKTTAARALSRSLGALLLTPDAWQIRLFGQGAAEPEHDARHSAIEAIQWDVAAQALALGVDVILDFGFWAREERDDFRQRAGTLGVGFRLHEMRASREALLERLAMRNRSLPEGAFFIAPEAMAGYMALYQPVEADETDEEVP